MKNLLATLLTLAACGCASTGLNNSSDLKPEERVTYWLHQDMVTMFRVIDLNGQKLRQEWLTKVTDVPGHKDMTLEMYFKYKPLNDESGPLKKLTFSFSFEAKAGYAYNVRLQNGSFNLVSESTRLCLLEEPSNAPGSSINFTNEFRTPSANALVLTCAPAKVALVEGT